MIRTLLLLMGSDFARRNWRSLALAGALWTTFGVLVAGDALRGAVYFPVRLFGGVILIDGLINLIAAANGVHFQASFRYAKGFLFTAIGFLLIFSHHGENLTLAILFGMAFLVGGLLQMATGYVVRFPGWRMSVGLGLFELVFAIFILEPLPTHYAGTLPYCIGLGLVFSGLRVLRLAMRLSRLPDHVPISFLSNTDALKMKTFIEETVVERPQKRLAVHVWTAVGAIQDPVRHPIIDRYVAAVDKKGVISTGHASLEVLPDIYISHYPAEDLNRSPDEFMHTLRATQENNVAGVFQPSYAVESKAWCPSTTQVNFHEFNEKRLRVFWKEYSKDTTHNLTHRNCSSTVCHALEAALEGMLAQQRRSVWAILNLLFSTELWAAGAVYQRAQTMAWTPGLVLDYARNLQAILHQPHRPIKIDDPLPVTDTEMPTTPTLA